MQLFLFCVFIKKINQINLDICSDILPEAMLQEEQTEMNLLGYSPEYDKATWVHTREAELLEYCFLNATYIGAAIFLLYLAQYNLYKEISL